MDGVAMRIGTGPCCGRGGDKPAKHRMGDEGFAGGLERPSNALLETSLQEQLGGVRPELGVCGALLIPRGHGGRCAVLVKVGVT